ncbi:MAG: chemotaxis protein [Desulfobacterales bacterium]|nr:chemotaxis protein [Desulfobacterales bacterium]
MTIKSPTKPGILLETGTNEMELLTVFVGGQAFGMNVAKVQSIQQHDEQKVTPLPESPPGIAGMYLYRDQTVPLLDLAQILGIDPGPASDREREIVVVTEFNNSVNSFKVQGVKRIYRMSWKEFVPMDAMLETNAYFTGSVQVEDTQILVLDLEHILASIFPDLIIEEVSEDVISQQEEIPRDQIEILFAEDSPLMRKSVVASLKKAGFSHITDFINGELAFSHIRANYQNPTPEELRRTVLITDIEMPKMDGLSLCRQIKQNPVLKNLYVVMFSSLINKQMIAKCQKVHADNYVTKPETSELIKMLDKRCRPD